ncbi:MATE family efflux transporter [Paenibacillus albidus]|uniref:MATE family efflux transporter n=1 Tax=Paenibacillus albidus TaxID=2041023 RepID=UPI001BE6B187|nr:MATE family efflux transporter [Paenibacillus albidus]MBT2288317.1 MATE family efflux transporter [Paenibacillus albidus]
MENNIEISSSEPKALTQDNNTDAEGMLSGPITRTTIKLSIPIFIAQILIFAYVMIDTLFISMIDKNSSALLAGTGLVYPIYMVIFNISTSLFVGLSSVASRGIGQKNNDVIKKIADSALVLSLILGVVTLVAGILFGQQVLQLLAGSQLTPEALQYGVDFFYYMLPCMVLLLFFNAFGGILQGEGKANQVGLAMMSSPVLNAILNPIFIFGLNMGVKGSGLASSIATAVPIVYFVAILLGKKVKLRLTLNPANSSKKLIMEILRIGVPASIGLLLINTSTMILNNVVGSISETAMNAWILVSRTDQLFLIPATAIAMATIPMIGQNFGSGDHRRAQAIYKANLRLCLGVCLVLTVFYIIFAPQVMGWFTNIQEVIDDSVRQVRLLAITSAGVAGITVIGSAFQGTGRPAPNLINDIVRMVIMSTPLWMHLFHISITDMTPVYISLAVGNLLPFVIALVWGRYHFNHLQSNTKSI